MRRGGRVLVMLGIVLAIISGAGVYVVLASAEPAPAEPPTTKLVVALQSIAERSEVGPDQVGIVAWPMKIPTPTGGTDKTDNVVGKFAKVAIYPQQPIIDQMLIDKNSLKESHSNAALLLEKGSVAVAMPVTVNTSVAEGIQAGDRVDILGTFTPPASSSGSGGSQAPRPATQVLLQDVLVLQVGPWPNPDVKKDQSAISTVVTFQLNEQDASVLKFSIEQSNGLTLVLRPANDHDAAKPEPVSLDYINRRFGFKFQSSGQ